MYIGFDTMWEELSKEFMNVTGIDNNTLYSFLYISTGQFNTQFMNTIMAPVYTHYKDLACFNATEYVSSVCSYN